MRDLTFEIIGILLMNVIRDFANFIIYFNLFYSRNPIYLELRFFFPEIPFKRSKGDFGNKQVHITMYLNLFLG